jgi:hypothetical protein
MVYQLEPLEESEVNPEKKVDSEKEKATHPETPIANVPVEKEVKVETAQEIASAEKDNAYSKILSQVKKAPAKDSDKDEVARDAEAANQKTDAQSQIQHLVDLAMQKGLFHAVKVAQHMQDNYILDMFHDKLLSEELHTALVKNGLIKEE